MSYRTEGDYSVIQRLNKGMNAYSPIFDIPDGYYADAENTDLRHQTPHTIDGTTALTAAPPDGGNIVWASPYYVGTIQETLIATDRGTVYAHSASGYRQLRTGLATNPRYYSSAQFRNQRILANGTDVPFRYDGVNLLPLGSQMIADFEADEAWNVGDGEATTVREGARALRLSSLDAGTVSTRLDFSTARDFLTGIEGAPNFGVNDPVRLQVYVPDPTAFSGQAVLHDRNDGAATTEMLIRYSAGHDFKAQKVTPTTSFSVSRIDLNLRRIGSPTGNLTLEIQTEAVSLPSNTPVTGGTSATVAESGVSTGYEWVSFVFSSLPALTGGTAYWLVLKSSRTASTTNYITWGRNASFVANYAENTAGAPTTWVAAGSFTLLYRLYGATGALELRFHTNVTQGDYFQAAAAGFVAGWNTIAIKRSDFGNVGTPSWASIARVEIRITASAATSVILDDLLLAYNLSPPAFQNVVTYSGAVFGGDVVGDRVKIVFSDVSQINYFPEANFVRVTGGTQGLETEDRVSALRVYASVVVVGKPRSIFSLSGAPGSLTLDPFTTEIGIDSHRGVIEGPRALYFPYGNSIVGLRLTARDIISTEIHPLLEALDYDQADQTVGIRHHESHTLRWSFRQKSQSQNDLQLWHDYIQDAWTSRVTAYRVRDFFSAIYQGTRKPHFVSYDAFVYAADVGTTVNGQAIRTEVILPPKFQAPASAPVGGNVTGLAPVTQWVGATLSLRGAATVAVYARGGNVPLELVNAAWRQVGAISSTAAGVEGYVDLAHTFRLIQLRLVSTSGQFEVMPPVLFHFQPTSRML